MTLQKPNLDQTSFAPPDKYHSQGGIKSKERSQKFAEVFTPNWMVKKMCDLIEQEAEPDADAYRILTRTWLDPAVGTGNFPAEILRRKFAVCETPFDGLVALGSVYAIDIQQDNVLETRERLKEMYAERFGSASPSVDATLEKNIVCGNFLTGLTSDGDKIWFLADEKDYWDYIERRQAEEAKKARAKAKKNG